MERLYTIREVSELLGRTEKTVRKFIGNGLTVCDIGRGYIIRESDLEKFLEKNKFPKNG